MIKKLPSFAPAGQSTQMVIGATPENDLQVLHMANAFYKRMHLKRVYYSGYVPISNDNRLPVIGTPVPFIRENRLYQADWLMRFYDFSVDEIITPSEPLLDMQVDPKLAWALRNMHLFPLDINVADYKMIMRIPGIGIQSAQRICRARKFSKLRHHDLVKMGVSFNKAKYFLTAGNGFQVKDLLPGQAKKGPGC